MRRTSLPWHNLVIASAMLAVVATHCSFHPNCVELRNCPQSGVRDAQASDGDGPLERDASVVSRADGATGLGGVASGAAGTFLVPTMGGSESPQGQGAMGASGGSGSPAGTDSAGGSGPSKEIASQTGGSSDEGGTRTNAAGAGGNPVASAAQGGSVKNGGTTASVTGNGGTSSAAGGGSRNSASSAGGAGGVQASPLGKSCAIDSECASGFCVDQVCCESACSGPCASCGTDGRCTMPPDDNACGPISCPQATACRSWETGPLTANRCKSVGVCKTSSDCGYTNTPVRTSCGASGELCDGAGACKLPTVQCGSVATCPASLPSIHGGGCCYQGETSNAMCQPAMTVELCTGDTWRPQGSTNAFQGHTFIQCDERGDCAAGQVCCFILASGAYSECRKAGDCVDSQYSSAYQLCNPNASECTSGTCAPAETPTLPASYHSCSR